MGKELRFAPPLVSLICSGEKTSTWRLWDDKNLGEGDFVYFFESGAEKRFASAKIVRIVEKKMGALTEEDKVGHEKFSDDTEMYKVYSDYYKQPVTRDTTVKIISFELISLSHPAQ